MDSNQQQPPAPAGAKPEVKVEHVVEKTITEKVEPACRDERVVLYSYPSLIYCWPIIFLGFFLWFTDRQQHPRRRGAG